MVDIHYIREHVDELKAVVHNKRAHVDIDELLRADEERRRMQGVMNDLQKERNIAAKAKDITKGKEVKEKLTVLEQRFHTIENTYQQLLLSVPNIVSEDTPIGADESGNVVLRTVGKVPKFSFTPKEHWELGAELDIIDTETASRVSGARFSYLKGGAAMLEFALVQLVLHTVTNTKTLHKIIQKAGLSVPATPFIPVVPPVFIRPEVFARMGRLEPKEERYYIPSDDVYLIGSAEHTLGPLHMDQTLAETALPIRYLGFSTSFRREAGSYGKDTKGLIRVHQFDKLEMESFCVAEQSSEEQQLCVAIQEYLLQQLHIPYQVMQICTGDMGGPDFRQIDINAYLPGQGAYRETHTADLMTDYQSRRLNIKVQRTSGAQELVHMNDATAIAIGRTLAAILENYQQEDGSVLVPKVLQPFAGFDRITKA